EAHRPHPIRRPHWALRTLSEAITCRVLVTPRQAVNLNHRSTAPAIQEGANTVDLSPREIKAIEIADRFRIAESSGKWIVPSQTHPTTKYGVRIVGEYAECDCPDFELRRDLCKHILAVKVVIKREHNADGTTTVTETFTVAKRTTYKQQWPAYNLAQTTEKDHFQILLADLCRDVQTVPQRGRGQRRLPLRDVVYAATFKVFSTMSGRRFMSDLREARERGHIGSTPH